MDTLSFYDGPHAVRRRIFASRADDALIMEVRLERPTDLRLSVESGCKEDGELLCEEQPDGTLFSMAPDTYALSGALRLLSADCESAVWKDGSCMVKGATYALFAYTLEPTADKAAASYAHLQTLSADCEVLLSRHTALHQPLMEQMSLFLNGTDAVPWSNEHLL